MRVVLDVSTSLAWTRPPVGIVRTERKFAAFLLEQTGVEVEFCALDRGHGRWLAVPRDTVRACVGPDVTADAAVPVVEHGETVAVGAGEPRLRLRRRMRGSVASAVRGGIARLPDGLRADAELLARSSDLFFKSLYWLVRGTWRALGRRAPAPPVSTAGGPPEGRAPEIELRADDVYVSMGLDWEYNDLAALYRLKRRHGFRTILYCYDLIPVRLPHLMAYDARQPFARYFVDLAHTADHVVAISRATRADYQDFLAEVGAPVPPISVIHLGTDIAERGPGAPPRAELARTPFVLCVGTIEARKNHEMLYHVWDRLAAQHGDDVPLLVLVGMVGWGVQDLLSRIRLNQRVADRIVILDSVADETLVWLYEHCLFTVYPSHFEGWGLPVVESLALGKPCVASNARALLEATRGLVPTIDPLDFPAWLEQIERWTYDRAALEAAGRRLGDYRPESWRDHGEAMLALTHAVGGTELCASSI